MLETVAAKAGCSKPLVAQIEGAVIMALSTALKEEVRFAKGGVASANFDDYRLMRIGRCLRRIRGN